MPPARLDSQDPGFARTLFAGAGPDYDVVSEWLSFGQYRLWQEALVDAAARHGLDASSEILDVATGTGKIAATLIRRLGCRVTGADLTRGMLQRSALKHRDEPHHRGHVQATADALPFPDATFDGLTFSYLYRYVPDPAATTRELVRVVRPRGFIGFVEFHVPPDPLARGLWRLHTRINLPLFGGLAGPEWRRIGRFLGPNIEAFYAAWDIDRLRRLFVDAGCVDVQARLMSLGGGLVLTARKGDTAPEAIKA